MKILNKEISNFTAMYATKWIRQNIFLQVESKVNALATTTQYSEVQVAKRIEVLLDIRPHV